MFLHWIKAVTAAAVDWTSDLFTRSLSDNWRCKVSFNLSSILVKKCNSFVCKTFHSTKGANECYRINLPLLVCLSAWTKFHEKYDKTKKRTFIESKRYVLLSSCCHTPNRPGGLSALNTVPLNSLFYIWIWFSSYTKEIRAGRHHSVCHTSNRAASVYLPGLLTPHSSALHHTNRVQTI